MFRLVCQKKCVLQLNDFVIYHCSLTSFAFETKGTHKSLNVHPIRWYACWVQIVPTLPWQYPIGVRPYITMRDHTPSLPLSFISLLHDTISGTSPSAFLRHVPPEQSFEEASKQRNLLSACVQLHHEIPPISRRGWSVCESWCAVGANINRAHKERGFRPQELHC